MWGRGGGTGQRFQAAVWILNAVCAGTRVGRRTELGARTPADTVVERRLVERLINEERGRMLVWPAQQELLLVGGLSSRSVRSSGGTSNDSFFFPPRLGLGPDERRLGEERYGAARSSTECTSMLYLCTYQIDGRGRPGILVVVYLSQRFVLLRIPCSFCSGLSGEWY